MNILFLVITFIYLFLFFDSMLFKESATIASEKKALCSYMEAKQKLQNKWEERKYVLHKKQRVVAQQNKTPKLSKKERKFYSPRLSKQICQQARWNLAPLLLTEENREFLQETTEKLLENLYGRTSFWEKNLAKNILLHWKQIAEETPSLLRLSDLFPEDETLRSAFYHMLKGSSTYDLSKGTGYPPLEDVFCISSENPRSCYFSLAPKSFLEALLSSHVLQEVLLEEKKQEKVLTKDHLFLLLARMGKTSLIPLLEESTAFSSHKEPQREVIHQTPDGIRLHASL